jgi:guanylate kinase
MNKLRPLVISGPSGCGKGTLINYALEKYKGLMGLSVSYTSRAPRKGETHGVEYFFVSKEEFVKVENHLTFLS